MKILNFFSANDDMSLDGFEPNLSDDIFANDYELHVDDNLFVNDDLLDINELFPTEQDSADFFAADNDLNCTSLSSLSRGIRARSGESCAAKPENYLVVRTDEDIKKYWCSESISPDLRTFLYAIFLTSECDLPIQIHS